MDNDISKYCILSERCLHDIHIPTDAVGCRDTQCTTVNHIKSLNKLYSLIQACEKFSQNKKRSYTNKPGWVEYVDSLYDTSSLRLHHCNTPLPSSIEGVSGGKEMVDLWRKHLCNLLNCANSSSVDVCEYDCDTSYDEIVVTVEEKSENYFDLQWFRNEQHLLELAHTPGAVFMSSS